MSKVRIELVKSMIGRKPNHIATLNSMGIRKVNDAVEHTVTPELKGKIALVSYLIKVEEV